MHVSRQPFLQSFVHFVSWSGKMQPTETPLPAASPFESMISAYSAAVHVLSLHCSLHGGGAAGDEGGGGGGEGEGGGGGGGGRAQRRLEVAVHGDTS